MVQSPSVISKIFLPDTNILVDNPSAIRSFGRNMVVLLGGVINELDDLKHKERVESSVRAASRQIEHYREAGSLAEGVVTEDEGFLVVDFAGPKDLARLPHDFRADTVDHRLIALALRWQELCKSFGKNKQKLPRGLSSRFSLTPETQVIIVSRDVNLRIKADSCGVKAEDYRSNRIISAPSELYTGMVKLDIPDEYSDDFYLLQSGQACSDSLLENILPGEQFYPNQCVTMQRGDHTVLAIRKKGSDGFRLVPVAKPTLPRGIAPRNNEQLFLYHLATDPTVELSFVVGPAGSGKTLISLLAAYQQLEKRFSKIIVFRPTTEVGRDLGTLPGDIDGKFSPHIRPIVDNLSFLAKFVSMGDIDNPVSRKMRTRKNQKTSTDIVNPRQVSGLIKQLIDSGKLEISPINFIRGRTISDAIVIIDEAQNMSRHDIKTIVTRMGPGTVVIVTGDPSQIDSTKAGGNNLDFLSNGLVVAIEKFRQATLSDDNLSCAVVTLTKTERSRLAGMAARIL